ncbi:MAG TPA: type II toxin-antitoxin system VapC family toxin [Terriglobales bacterium]|nr:type II toxin-antitoxin system VapC family toxin [Terriglobales bacterium]
MDTHVVIWLALEPARISKKARMAIEETRQRGLGLAVADISLLEIATLESKRRVQLNSSLETFLSEIEIRFILLPITARICARAMAFSAPYPKDPADRIIGATALVEGTSLVTADDEIRQAKAVPTIW